MTSIDVKLNKASQFLNQLENYVHLFRQTNRNFAGQLSCFPGADQPNLMLISSNIEFMENIKEIQDVQSFLVETINATDKSYQDDGKLTGRDAFNFGGAVIKLPEAIIGIGKVGQEWNDLDEAERTALKKGWMGITLKDEEIEAELEAALGEATALASRIGHIVRLIRVRRAEDGKLPKAKERLNG